MKIKHSLVTRRNFLNGLLGGWAAALGATFLAPLVKFVFPPYKEPDEVILPWADYSDMQPNTVRIFPWGANRGSSRKTTTGATRPSWVCALTWTAT